MRTSSWGGKRLAPLPGVSIPLNEFDDKEEYKQQMEVDEDSPWMQPNQLHEVPVEEESPEKSPDPLSPDDHFGDSPDPLSAIIDGGEVVADEFPEQEQ